MTVEIVSIDCDTGRYTYYTTNISGYPYRNLFSGMYAFYTNMRTKIHSIKNYVDKGIYTESYPNSVSGSGNDKSSILNDEQRLKVSEFIKNSDILKTDITFYNSYESTFSKINQHVYSANNPEEIAKNNPYPIAVRYIYANNVYAIERYPFQIDVNFDKLTDLKIWVPWTLSYYNPEENNFTINFSDKPLQSKDDVYLSTIYPNQYANGKICFGSERSAEEVIEETGSLSNNIKQRYSALINEYFSGGWNYDLSPKPITILKEHSTRNNISHNDTSIKKYETLYNFLNIDIEYFQSKLSKENFKKFSRLVGKCKTVNELNWDRFIKYYFYTLSTYDLETTLKFYGELIEYCVEFNKNAASETVLSFEDTYDLENNHDMGYYPDLHIDKDKKYQPVEKIFPYISTTLYALDNKSKYLKNINSHVKYFETIAIYFYNIDFANHSVRKKIDYNDNCTYKNVGEYFIIENPFIIDEILENINVYNKFIFDLKDKVLTPISINIDNNFMESLCLIMAEKNELVQKTFS